MNRYKKEEKKRYDEARKGLSKDEIIALNLKEKIREKIANETHSLHCKEFPEEYDYMYDSNVDAKERHKGINPMKQEYIDKTNKKREELGFAPLSDSGYAKDHSTDEHCYATIKHQTFSAPDFKRPPSPTCVFCNKRVNETGDQRIVSSNTVGVILSTKNIQEIGENTTCQSIQLFSSPNLYMHYWGDKEKWTDCAIESARTTFLDGDRAWICQTCFSELSQKNKSSASHSTVTKTLSAYGDIQEK